MALAVLHLAAGDADNGNDLAKVARLYNRQHTRSQCSGKSQTCEVHGTEQSLLEACQCSLAADERTVPPPCSGVIGRRHHTEVAAHKLQQLIHVQ